MKNKSQSTKKKVAVKKGTQASKTDKSKPASARKNSVNKADTRGSKAHVKPQQTKQTENFEASVNQDPSVADPQQSVQLEQLSIQHIEDEEVKEELKSNFEEKVAHIGEQQTIKGEIGIKGVPENDSNKTNTSFKTAADHMELDAVKVKQQINANSNTRRISTNALKSLNTTTREDLGGGIEMEQPKEEGSKPLGLSSQKTMAVQKFKQFDDNIPIDQIDEEENEHDTKHGGESTIGGVSPRKSGADTVGEINKQFTVGRGGLSNGTGADQEVTHVEKLDADFGGMDMALGALIENGMEEEKEVDHNDINLGLDDDGLDNIVPHQSKDTQGNNLGDVKEDLKSQAFTEKALGAGNQNDLFYPEVGQDKYSAGDHLMKKPSDVESLDELKFFGEDHEIQPKNTLDAQHEPIREVMASWSLIQDIGVDFFGAEIFKNMFFNDPKSLWLFSFKNEERLYKSEAFVNHYRRVTDALSSMIAGLHDIGNLQMFLKQLGKTHQEKGVEKKHYQLFGKAIMVALEMCLKEKFTSLVKHSWMHVLRMIFAYMISDHYEEQAVSDTNEFSDRKILLIQDSWKLARQNEFLGISFFKTMFKLDQGLISKFPFQDTPDLYISDQFTDHQKRVIDGLDHLVDTLHVHDGIVAFMKKMAKIHHPLKLADQDFQHFGQALILTIKTSIQDRFSLDIERAWQIGFTTVTQVFIDELHALDLEASNNPSTPTPVVEVSKSNNEDVSDFDNIGLNKDESIYLDHSVHRFEAASNSHRDEMMDEVDALTENIKSVMNGGKNYEYEKDSDASAIVQIKEAYLHKFRKEVDFHHKIAYRFEKAYRLKKKMVDGPNYLNVEIIECISEHSGYLEQDPMVFFYCLYFCIYYKNEKLVDFFRALIHKTKQNEKTDRLLEYIDSHGIERLRTVGEQINSIVYHMVFYQAVDDDLKIVYSQILLKLKFIQLRDKDALQLLKQRDYDLIRESFEKYTTKINLSIFFKKSFPMKSQTYRRYNRAYFEEIVINNEVEPRVARNYREKFLVTAEDIYNVFEMYCKEDYDEQFLGTKKDNITHKQFVDLFVICLKNDSFKIATIIYLMFLNHTVDIDQKMMDIILSTIRESPRYHEIKLFYIHEHFDILSIQQMNQLLDIYQEILSRQNAKENPMISQFNTIKVTLLIYRICWKIEEKQIYSLITKCSLLQTYLINSLSKYFEYQNNILVLHKFMSEPILHMTERKDSLDIMYEMNMKELLQHPVVVEVINLVYEGEYSISSTSLSLSRTFLCMLEMDIFDQKSICQRMIQNISNFGDTNNKKQSSLMYNIWKQSILQREQDEMQFTNIINLLLILFSVWVNQIHNDSYVEIKDIFGNAYFDETQILLTSSSKRLTDYCQKEVDSFLLENSIIGYFYYFILIQTIGMITSIIQRFITLKFKDNVTLDFMQVALEVSIVINGIFFMISINTQERNSLLSDFCGSKIFIADGDKDTIDYIYTLRHPREDQVNFRLVLSVLIIQSSIAILYMLQRTQYLGQTIMMLTFMISEIMRFFATFGIIMLIFIIVGAMLQSDLKYDGEYSYWQSFIDLYKTFNGAKVLHEFQVPLGQAYITLYMYVFQIFLMSLLVAMFINKQTTVMRNLDAYRRFNIIRLKNSEQYDQYIGGITVTFFPINILMLPFVIPVIALRNPRISDFALKLQYTVMILLYLIVTSFLVIPMLPLLYLKSMLNAFHIAKTNKREDYRYQNVNQVLTAVFLGPIIVLISMLVDILIFPSILLMSSDEFEHKYQMSSEKLSRPQMNRVMTLFKQKFTNQDKKLRDEMITLEQLMLMHRNFFKIIDNLHDLTCKGIKDYKKALSIVQDYNMSKILSKKFSIPHKSGEFRRGRCEMELLYNVQTDIQLYNYIDVLLRKKNMGILEQDMWKRQKERSNSEEDEQLDDKGGNKLDESADMTQAKQIGEEEGILPTEFGPDGVLLKRNSSDLMNNFFIDIISLSYLDSSNGLSTDQNKLSQIRAQELETELTKRQDDWKRKTVKILEKYTKRYVKIAKWQVNPDSEEFNEANMLKTGKSIKSNGKNINILGKKRSTLSSTDSEEKRVDSLEGEGDKTSVELMKQETHDFRPRQGTQKFN